MEKKKVLFVINSLDLGGAEKSLISLLPLFDYSKFDVDLLLLREGGVFRNFLDEHINVLPLLKYIQFSNQPLLKQISSLNIKYIKTRLVLAKALKDNAKSEHKSHNAEVYWRCCKDVFENLSDEYDLAIGWGQGVPVKYVANKVTAKKKAVWINADYEAVGHKREDDLENFSKVNYIVSVSDKQNENMKLLFPEYSNKCQTIYDVNNAELIEKMANQEDVLTDFDGIKIVTV